MPKNKKAIDKLPWRRFDYHTGQLECGQFLSFCDHSKMKESINKKKRIKSSDKKANKKTRPQRDSLVI